MAEAGAILAGGHTLEDDEPKYGLAAVGLVLQPRFLLHSRGKCSAVHDVALSPVDDSQVGIMGGSVRDVRMRGVRPLHHVVPSRN